MRAEPIGKNGVRFAVTLQGRNDLDDFCLGLGWLRRRALSYDFDRVGQTTTTRSGRALLKITTRMRASIDPEVQRMVYEPERSWLSGDQLDAVERAKRIGRLASRIEASIEKSAPVAPEEQQQPEE